MPHVALKRTSLAFLVAYGAKLLYSGSQDHQGGRLPSDPKDVLQKTAQRLVEKNFVPPGISEQAVQVAAKVLALCTSIARIPILHKV